MYRVSSYAKSADGCRNLMNWLLTVSKNSRKEANLSWIKRKFRVEESSNCIMPQRNVNRFLCMVAENEPFELSWSETVLVSTSFNFNAERKYKIPNHVLISSSVVELYYVRLSVFWNTGPRSMRSWVIFAFVALTTTISNSSLIIKPHVSTGVFDPAFARWVDPPPLGRSLCKCLINYMETSMIIREIHSENIITIVI